MCEIFNNIATQTQLWMYGKLSRKSLSLSKGQVTGKLSASPWSHGKSWSRLSWQNHPIFEKGTGFFMLTKAMGYYHGVYIPICFYLFECILETFSVSRGNFF